MRYVRPPRASLCMSAIGTLLVAEDDRSPLARLETHEFFAGIDRAMLRKLRVESPLAAMSEARAMAFAPGADSADETEFFRTAEGATAEQLDLFLAY